MTRCWRGTRTSSPAREADKWGFLPPGGESYAQLTLRVQAGTRPSRSDTVVAAHGGTARALIAHLAIAPPEDATHYSIEQGWSMCSRGSG